MRYSPAILVGLLSFTGSLLAGPVLYSVSVVSVPTGDTFASGTNVSLNNLGQVAGIASVPGGGMVPFITTGSTSVAVPFPSSPQGYIPRNVFLNDAGQLAGQTQPFGPAYFGAAAGVAFVPGTSSGVAVTGISNSGAFVGTTSGVASGFVGTSAGITLLPYENALLINNAGEILVGTGGALFILSGSTPTSIPGTFNPTGMNDAGQVVGDLSNGNEALISTAGGVTLIPGPPGPLGTEVGLTRINNLGTVVGSAVTPSSGSLLFLWDPTNGTQALEPLVPAGYMFFAADDINDSGQIVAIGTFMGGPEEAFLLDPVATPEPSTISLMLATIALFATIHFARRRRSLE